MKNTTDTEFDTADDAAVELLLAQARLITDQIERVLNRPLAGEGETLHATVDPEVLACLREARELLESRG